MIENLFVYGTLAPGRPNDHWLKNIGGSWQEASVTGRLCQKGWGATLGYPAIILDEEGDGISGFLFSSEKLANHWLALDEFEGSAYQRVSTAVTLKDGSTVDAFIYELKRSASPNEVPDQG